MSQPSIGYIDQNARSNWMRLRTLVLVRWFAIAGQVLALVIGQQLYGLKLALGPCAIAIGLSVLTNLLAVVIFPDNRRLSEAETVLTLLFDTLQLSLLLAFTGGLNNPFALLILAPVTIAATVLPSRSTLLLASCAVGMVTIVGLVHIPLRTENNNLLEMPVVFVFGFWVAIVTGIIFISIYTRRVTAEMTSMSEALLATQMALAREQKLTDLGGVVAATAHELGTPLATIKLVSAELMEELQDAKDLHSDAQLIHEQAERCGDILRSMGRAGKDDLHLRITPWSALVREAAEPHLDRGKNVKFVFSQNLEFDMDQPKTLRKPEVIHGLRNLIQNAVDFAQSEVRIDVGWSEAEIFVTISDDGSGFAPQVINRIGDPFMRRKKHDAQSSARPGYDGMGLGLFIAKTLLERSGSELEFLNASTDHSLRGAVVRGVWPRGKLEAAKLPIGQNRPIGVS
jgi:two-component system sensor histidine kinase RegB|tara:strand:- start:1270 stop:2637 length:1368 start_codon:yes stop_codon:yes gene_type:complete